MNEVLLAAAPSARVPTLLGFLPLALLLVLLLEREVLRARDGSSRSRSAERVLLFATAPLVLAFVLFAALNVALNLG